MPVIEIAIFQLTHSLTFSNSIPVALKEMLLAPRLRCMMQLVMSSTITSKSKIPLFYIIREMGKLSLCSPKSENPTTITTFFLNQMLTGKSGSTRAPGSFFAGPSNEALLEPSKRADFETKFAEIKGLLEYYTTSFSVIREWRIQKKVFGERKERIGICFLV